MPSTLRGLLPVLFFTAVAVAPSGAGVAAADSLHTVQRGPFRIEVKVEGIIDSTRRAEIAARPEQWSDLTVREAIAHGRRVHEGTIVLRLETTQIDKAIRDREAEQALTELSILQAEEELRLLEKSVPLQLEAAERTHRLAREDLRHFRRQDRAERRKILQFNVKRARQHLDYRLEELKQLEKMYKEDDLTEESEEIILRRAANDVAESRFALHRAELSLRETENIDLPRRETHLEAALREAAQKLREAETTLPIQIKQKSLEREKLRLAQRKKQEELEQLREDRQRLTVRSPIDGLAYYGQFTDGKLPDATAAAAPLQPGSKLKPHQVVMTVVEPEPLVVTATITEEDLAELRRGAKGIMTPTRYPNATIACRLSEISPVPIAPGKFRATIELAEEEPNPRLVPGLNCKVLFVVYEKQDAISVPTNAVHVNAEGGHDVVVRHLKTTKEKPAVEEGELQPELETEEIELEQRPVKVGRRTKEQVEIVRGLKPGDIIILP